MTNSLDAFLWAERQQESGGNYHAVNASSGALGAYQVMPANLPSWTQRALGRVLTPSEYLNDPAAQDAVARTVLGGYYSKYGPEGAAAAWYSGQPDPNATYGNPPVYKYVASVMALMGSPGAANAGGLSTGGTTAQPATDVQQSSDTTGDGCLVGFSLPVTGHVCLLTKGQGRAILGGMLLVSGGIIAGAGLIILASYGLKKSGALDAAASAAGALPGGGALAAPIAAASGRVKNGPAPRPKKPKQEQRQEQRQEPKQGQEPKPEEDDDDDEAPSLGDLVRAAIGKAREGITGEDDGA